MLRGGALGAAARRRCGACFSATTAVAESVPAVTFHRKPLPAHLIPFSSPRGRKLFAEAMRGGGLKSYFHLAEHFETQREPAFCGIGTLTMTLNALGIDPGRRWKGVWRWYDDTMLECCVPMRKFATEGMSFDEFASLARCNGTSVTERRAGDCSLEDFRKAVADACQCSACDEETHDHSQLEHVLVASYNRAVLGQTGEGHFSPIAAYAPESDAVLVLDVARFKYPPHWVPTALLWDAMRDINPWNGKSRGFFTLRKPVGRADGRDRCPVRLRTWGEHGTCRGKCRDPPETRPKIVL